MMQATVTYYDTAMVMIEVGGLRLLTDPVLEPPGTRVQDGPVVLEKSGRAPVPSGGFGRIDAVLLSHDQHADNLDAAGRALLATVPRVLTTPAAAARLGAGAEGLSPWQSVTLRSTTGVELSVTAVPAQHGPTELLEAVGPVTGFVLAIVGSEARPLYVSGDTIPFDGLQEIARRYAPVGAALLHLGRARVAPLGPVSLSMTAVEAAEYAHALDAAAVIPIHHEGWNHFTEGRREAEPVLIAAGLGERTRWLQRGESTVVGLGAL